MKTLDSTKTKSDEEKKRKQQTMISERLDVENEEEATSHWQHSTTGSSVGQGAAAEDANDAKLAMEATFHKATNGRKQENRQIHIQLETVQHASIGYAEFKKSFLPERDTASGDHWTQAKLQARESFSWHSTGKKHLIPCRTQRYSKHWKDLAFRTN